MSRVALILRKPPYGEIHAAEAIRHALGGAGRMDINLLLVESGVLLAKTGQEEEDTGFTNLGEVLQDCIEKGIEVYADKTSMEEQQLKTSDIIEGVRVAEGKDIAEKIREAKSVMIF